MPLLLRLQELQGKGDGLWKKCLCIVFWLTRRPRVRGTKKRRFFFVFVCLLVYLFVCLLVFSVSFLFVCLLFRLVCLFAFSVSLFVCLLFRSVCLFFRLVIFLGVFFGYLVCFFVILILIF